MKDELREAIDKLIRAVEHITSIGPVHEDSTPFRIQRAIGDFNEAQERLAPLAEAARRQLDLDDQREYEAKLQAQEIAKQCAEIDEMFAPMFGRERRPGGAE